MTIESFGFLIGGIGLFLLGMDLMTDGMRMAAGGALVRGMKRLTGNPIKGILSGALVTALVQSSSATTLMTIGMVSAGVLSFHQSVGVIFGANIGTTMTSWLVSLVGLKFKIAVFAYPFVGVGAMMRALGRGRWRYVGAAVAGFGLLFIGIDLLQAGMADLSGSIDTNALNPETFWGRTALVLAGLVMTVVMQSSSAAVASTLAALDSGAITVAAAAALVIGQNLGTTITAAIGAAGATVPAKRTAVAHIGFNMVAGLVAFAMFPLFEQAVVEMANYAGASSPTTQIAAFHTAFNVLGLLVLLPFFDPFCRAVERLVPGAPRRYTSVLDTSSLKVPAAAVSAIHASLLALLRGAIELSKRGLDGTFDEAESTLLQEEMQRASKFLLQIVTDSSDDIVHQQHIDALHAMDHIERLIHVVVKPSFYEQASEVDADVLVQALRDAYDLVGSEPSSSLVASAREMSQGVAQRRASIREEFIHEMAHKGAVEPNDVSDTLRFIVRVDRVLYHLWRGLEHLNGINQRAEDLAPRT